MASSETTSAGSDWTKLLADPEIAGHLGELLCAYREAPPEKRDQVLLEAMRTIKGKQEGPSSEGASPVVTATAAPPFAPDLFTPNWGQDRRRYPRMQCFVAVELRIENSTAPVWGNLANTSLGGCFVETASALGHGSKLELGLWVANGKIWVKGLILNGVVTQSTPSYGIRIKFVEMDPKERESLRQFLKFVENTTRGYQQDHGYLAQLKR